MGEAKQALKIVKKKWLPIRASKFFDNQFLGECYVPGPEHLLGRTVAANLANLTGDIRQQSVTLKFVVRALDNEAGIAEVVGYEMAPSAVKRVVRKGADRIDESFICETASGQKVRIKPMLITKASTNSSVHRLLRKGIAAGITRYVKGHTFESLINEIVSSKLQTELKAELKKAYPLKSVEVRALELVREEKKGDENKGEEAGQAAEPAEQAATAEGMEAETETAEKAEGAEEPKEAEAAQ